ncbi:hypothetical protein V1512DRAFT_235942 [Lipomyces arxii]|uniref:uncharacterized protein n=1 Tax=Lipomyces arxii TaxID=56418 RepID=UPI0034CF9BDD
MSAMDIDPPSGAEGSNNGANSFRGRGRGGFRGRGRNNGRSRGPHAPNGDWNHDMYRVDSLFSSNGGNSKNVTKNKSPLAVNALAARIGKGGSAPPTPSTRPVTAKQTIAKSLANNPLFAALQGTRVVPKNKVVNTQEVKAPIVSKPKKTVESAAKMFDIKGSSGKTFVRISNLAPGTTEEDVYAFLNRLGGEVESSAVMAAQNSVVAEVVYAERSNADACVTQIDNAMADGRIIKAEIVSSSQLKTSLQQKSHRAPVVIQDGTQKVSALYSDALIKRGRGFSSQQ